MLTLLNKCCNKCFSPMSAIGAIYHLNGKIAEERSLVELNQGSARHGLDGLNHWLKGACGLTQAHRQFTSESKQDISPYLHEPSQLAVASHSRLFNRKELLTLLKLNQTKNIVTNTQLIRCAYLTWGLDFVTHFVGEFNIALWDERLKRLILAVDHFNASPVYYFLNKEILAASSVLSALVQLKCVPRALNLGVIARHDFRRFSLELGETCFQNIYFLPPASILVADKSGISIKIYWQPALDDPVFFHSKSNFQEEFEYHFSNSVRATLHSDTPVCLQLSGGLDSSAIALMGAKILASEPKQLICLSNLLPEGSPDFLQDEREYIHWIKASPLIKEAVTSPGSGPFDYLERCSKELYLSPQYYQHHAISRAARAYGSDVILHGTLAELTTSYSGYEYLAELFHHLRWVSLVQELIAHRRNYPASFLSLVSRLIHPRLFNSCFNSRKNSNRQKLLSLSFIKKEFIREHVLPQELAWLIELLKHNMTESLDARQNALAKLKHYLRHSSTLFSQMDDGVDNALYFSNPYFDKRLVSFCLNVPNQYRFNNGYPRSIIRIGMENYLPKTIATRTTKSPFLPDYSTRFNQQIPKAKEALAAVKNNYWVQQVIDINRLEYALGHPSDTNSLDSQTNFLNYLVIPSTIYLAIFLSSFS